ncbi:MAG: site-2 protease family protein [Oscillospiraceae bacterium]|jgi:regulator of sigma E protease|nr:site-2 protease family protein [Oscillospiraceae bacterium]
MNIGTILIAILVFGLLIFIHELGHFLTAKWSGMKVNEFALGMGPTLFSFSKGETKYALRLFPIGGFVAVEGENEDSGDKRAFGNVHVAKRVIFVIAGAVMNITLGLVILGILSAQQSSFGSTQIAAFNEGAASNQQLKIDDKIIKIDGHRVRTDKDIIYEFMRARDGQLSMVVERDGAQIPLDVQFQMEEADDGSGVSFINIDFRVYGVPKTFGGVIQNTFNWTATVVKQVWGSLVDLVTGRFGFNQLSGPVGVTEAIGKASSAGFDSLLLFVAYITVNLGVFNLLPIPALDGGRLIFLIIEIIRRKPINPKYENIVNATGFVLLIGLMICVTFNDVLKIFTR